MNNDVRCSQKMIITLLLITINFSMIFRNLWKIEFEIQKLLGLFYTTSLNGLFWKYMPKLCMPNAKARDFFTGEFEHVTASSVTSNEFQQVFFPKRLGKLYCFTEVKQNDKHLLCK